MLAHAHRRYTWRQYVLLERDSNVRHEFVDGEILAMAGGSPEHAALSAAICRVLGNQLGGRPCRPYSSDLRIRAPEAGLTAYPDVSVVCDPIRCDPEDANTVLNPTVIVEVLSESTEAYDRGDKLEAYQTIPSLKEYVLVSTRERLIEVFRRRDNGEWKRSEAGLHSAAKLDSIQCQLDVDAIYDGIDLDRRQPG